MTEEEIERAKAHIDRMSQYEMAELWRFAPSGHPCFDKTQPLADYFEARFRSLGWFTPTISKALGWDKER